MTAGAVQATCFSHTTPLLALVAVLEPEAATYGVIEAAGGF